eukprot:1547748-Amphidinium_carterae.1
MRAQLYKGGSWLNMSHRMENDQLILDIQKEECPRRSNGPSGVRSLVESLVSAVTLARLGATLFVPAISERMSNIVAGAKEALPFGHLLHARVVVFLDTLDAPTSILLSRGTIEVARQSVKELRAFAVGFDVGRHGVDGYYPAPGDEAILDAYKTTYEEGVTTGGHYKTIVVEREVADSILSVVMASRPAVTKNMSREQIFA